MVMVITSRLRPPPDMRGHLRARGLRGHPRALRAANGGAAEGAGEESGVRVRVNGNSSGRGRKRDDVARAEVCREDDVREVRRSLG